MIPLITIDGPSGSGKGTVARQIAAELDWNLLDSGALYRLVALVAGRSGTDWRDRQALADIAAGLAVRFDSDALGNEQIWLDGEEVSTEIRSETCGEMASRVATRPEVRTALVGLQRSYHAPPGLIADGRDMGTVIFPDAVLKIFLTATPEERAKRRHKQLKEKGIGVSLPALSREIAERDARDASRAVAPLVAAADARILDTTELPSDAVVEQVRSWAAEIFDL